MELQERIKELEEMFIRKKSYERKLEETSTDWLYLKERKKELYKILENENVKIRDLENKTIIHLWYDLFVTKGKDVSNEMHEYKMIYDLYELMNTEIIELRNKIESIEEYKEEYEGLLKEKDELVLENDKEKYQKISKLDIESNKIKNHIRNINDSINTLNHLKSTIGYLLDLLKKSKEWDSFDIFGRGLFLSVTKTSIFKKSEEKIKSLFHITNKLIRELKVVNYYIDMQFDISPIIKFYDYFTEELYYDLIDKTKVIHAIEMVKNTHIKLLDLNNYLSLLKENYILQLIENEKERRKFIS